MTIKGVHNFDELGELSSTCDASNLKKQCNHVVSAKPLKINTFIVKAITNKIIFELKKHEPTVQVHALHTLY